MEKTFKTNCNNCKKVFSPKEEGKMIEKTIFEIYFYCDSCCEKLKIKK